MTHTSESRALVQPPARLSVHHVALMRPELPGLIAEILAEVVANVPGYEQLLDSPFGGLMRQCVQRNVATFVARIADPAAVSPERDELCRTVGRLEALNGHSMDRLQTAYRVGVRVAWRRWVRVSKRHSIATPIMSTLADSLFSYVDEMTSLSREGHAEGRARSGRRVEEQRARLLARLVSKEPAPHGILVELAEQAAWPLPEEATPVVVEAATGTAADRAAHERTAHDQAGAAHEHEHAALDRAALDRAALDSDVLANLDDPRPHLLIPGPMTASREHMLAGFLGPAHAAIGLTVPLTEVAHSVRWARRTLAIAPQDADLRLVRSEDHLLNLWLCSDPDLARHIAARQFAPLQGFTESRRTRLTDTLLAWLSTRGNVEQMAHQLALHPQTVRYRLRALDKTLGPLLEDPEWRLATELVLRKQQTP